MEYLEEYIPLLEAHKKLNNKNIFVASIGIFQETLRLNPKSHVLINFVSVRMNFIRIGCKIRSFLARLLKNIRCYAPKYGKFVLFKVHFSVN